MSYIHNLGEIRRAGDYEIRANDAAASEWRDDYLLNGIRTINGSRDAVGIPADLLTQGPDAELRFGFQVSRAGPLLSVQQPGSDSDDEVLAAEPVAYVARNGVLMMREKKAPYVLVKQAAVLDGRWHELSLRRAKDSWRISVDGIPEGRVSGLFTGSKPSGYLQVGPAYLVNSSNLGSGWVRFFGKLRDVRVGRVRSNLGPPPP